MSKKRPYRSTPDLDASSQRLRSIGEQSIAVAVERELHDVAQRDDRHRILRNVEAILTGSSEGRKAPQIMPVASLYASLV